MWRFHAFIVIPLALTLFVILSEARDLAFTRHQPIRPKGIASMGQKLYKLAIHRPLVKERDGWVVSQFEFLFLYGPRFFGAGFRASIIASTSSHSHTRSVNPACMAGVTRKVL